jgi:hypothetical protein
MGERRLRYRLNQGYSASNTCGSDGPPANRSRDKQLRSPKGNRVQNPNILRDVNPMEFAARLLAGIFFADYENLEQA